VAADQSSVEKRKRVTRMVRKVRVCCAKSLGPDQEPVDGENHESLASGPGLVQVRTTPSPPNPPLEGEGLERSVDEGWRVFL